MSTSKWLNQMMFALYSHMFKVFSPKEGRRFEKRLALHVVGKASMKVVKSPPPQTSNV